jgi:hypothetical protein
VGRTSVTGRVELRYTCGGAMDVTTDESRIYWTDWFRGHVFAAAKTGGPRESLASSQRFAFRSPIVTDDTHVYWTTEDPERGMLTGAIVRRHKRDWGPVERFVGDQKPVGALAMDEEYVYATVPLGGAVVRVGKDTARVETLASDEAQPLGLALDAEHVYWCSQSDGTLKRRRKDGGTGETLAEGLHTPVALSVDETAIYVAGKTAGGSISRVDLRNHEVRVFVSDQQRPSHIDHDDHHIYWTTVGGVWRADKHEGRVDRLSGFARVPDPDNPQMLEHAPMGIAVDESSVYWVDIGEFGGLYGGTKTGIVHLT